MSATVADRPVTSGKVNESLFLGVAQRYAKDRKLVDALITSGNPDDAISRATAVIGELKSMVANGGDYTPAVILGFDSSNASTIAARVLGLGQTGAQIKRLFSDLGKVKKS